MMDFNDPSDADRHRSGERDAVRADLLASLPRVLSALLPNGKVSRQAFRVGDVSGAAGDSLEVVLAGDKAGLWTDRATGRGGDLFDLIAAHYGLDAHSDFAAVLEQARALLGRAPKARVRGKPEPLLDDLGPPTAKWDYLDANGHLVACVYRYDPPSGKEYRPWDPRRRKPAPPSPRPLYNQPGMAEAITVVLVEGEKSAQALIDIGVCATTAMHGANAPVEKTDWTPLARKHVLIWPDRDQPGWDYAVQAADAVMAAGAASCAILYPPKEKPEGWDAANAVAERDDEANEEPFDIEGFLRAGQRFPVERKEAAVDFSGVNWRSEDGIATAFARKYGRDWRYCAPWGQWFVWDGRRWSTDRTLAVFDLARGICRAASKLAEKQSEQTKLASAATTAAVERFARADRVHAATTDEWDANPWALNTPGGVIDLKTGVLRPHARAERHTRMATASLGGSAAPCRWLRFLDDITVGNVELQRYLQRVVGYCLTGTTGEHALFFLYGTGSNGKSVFINVVSALLGDYAANASMETFMDTRNERHPTDLAGLRGARFVSSIETEQGRHWNEAKLKAITGGDKISARFMRQDFFEYIPQFKLAIAGNHKPSIRNVDEAIKRRLHLIPFTVTIPPHKRDKKLLEALLAERDGIMTWAVAGCLAWQREGLNPPHIVVEATQEYFEDEDPFRDFLALDCELSQRNKVACASLYQRWRMRCEERGEPPGNIRWFMEQLISRGFVRVRLHGGVKGVAGLALKPLLPVHEDLNTGAW